MGTTTSNERLQCVRCGRHIEPRALWCPRCRERVQEELDGKADREYRYYFRFHLKRMRHDYNTMGEVLKKYRKEK